MIGTADASTIRWLGEQDVTRVATIHLIESLQNDSLLVVQHFRVSDDVDEKT